MSAIKAVICRSLAENQIPLSADATSAYVQSMLPSHLVIYGHIDREIWSPAMVRAAASVPGEGALVWRLARPLYGLSCSGGLWEAHLDGKLKALGWTRTNCSGQTYQKRNMTITIYVDDIIGGGKGIQEEFDALAKVVDLGEITPVSKILGTNFSFVKEKTASGLVYSVDVAMTDYIKDVVSRFETEHGPVRGRGLSPMLDVHEKLDEESILPGSLGKTAQSIVMALLYCARMARPDLLFPCNVLSRSFSRWTKQNDLQLHQLLSYAKRTALLSQHNTVVVDDPLVLSAYVDADHAGQYSTPRSTSGGALFLTSPRGGSFLVDYFSRRQTCTASSSTEAEIIALSKLLREYIHPMEELSRVSATQIHEDNQACILICGVGWSPVMRHLAKHAKVSLGAVSEMLRQEGRSISYIATEEQAADLMTKSLAGIKLARALLLVGIKSQ
jgi:hypothetical protein